jgi:ABC-type polysaccharide/polyol phosphate export permease
MTSQLLIFGVLGIASTALAFWANRHLFGRTDGRGNAGPVSLLEGVYYVVGACSLVLGWYFNVRYTHLYGHRANYINFTKQLFTNWAADSAAQDYIIVNVVLLPLWTIVEGGRRGLRWAWIFFIMSLFTSLAFSVAMFLAFMERQFRYNRSLEPAVSSSTA